MSTCWFVDAATAKLWTNDNAITMLFLAETALGGFMRVSMFAMFMGLCWPPVAATQFTAYLALINVSNGLGAIFADKFESSFTMSGAHVAVGCIQVALVGVVLMIDPNETRRILGDGFVKLSPGPQPDAYSPRIDG